MKKSLIAAALVLSLSAVAVACDDGDEATPEPAAEATPIVTEAPTEAPPEETEAPADEATPEPEAEMTEAPTEEESPAA